MEPSKKARTREGLCQEILDQLDETDNSQIIYTGVGLAGGEMVEPLPIYNKADCEKVISGKNNTWIVLGRDRPSGITSGRNANTQAGAIDIVVGRMGANVVECEKGGKKVFVDPIFSADAARIYMSQKTDIDKNFNLAPGSIGSPGLYHSDTFSKKIPGVPELHPKSGIAIKADDIRLISRRGIKLVTMQPGAESISTNKDKTRSIQGINLIAGNKTSGRYFQIEPIVKGNSLNRCLAEMVTQMSKLTGCVWTLLKFQHELNSAVTAHTHAGIDGTTRVIKSEVVDAVGQNTTSAHNTTSMTDLETIKSNIELIRTNYIGYQAKKSYLSRWNFVN